MMTVVNFRVVRAGLVVVLGGLAMVAALGCRGGDRLARSGAPGLVSVAKPKTLYHCPMHPTMVADKPGDCPICSMRMVPAGNSEPSQTTALPQALRKKVIFQSTMNTGELSDQPGKDSMGMEMVSVETDVQSPGAPAVEG